MNVDQVLSDFRLEAGWADTNQITDANALILANKIYRQAINKIKSQVNQDFFYDYWLVDNSVIWQSEYKLPIRDDATFIAWCTKVKWVSIKYNETDTEFTKCRANVQDNLSNDLLWYGLNQAPTDPFFTVSDMSTFVYPAPIAVIADSIILYWIADPANLADGWAETTIKIPLEYHDIIPLGMVYLYYKTRTLTQEKNDALNEYNLFMDRMISELSDRIDTSLTSIMPDLTSLR